MNKTKDYYKILGVARDCGETDIIGEKVSNIILIWSLFFPFPFFFLSDQTLVYRVVMKRNLNWSPKLALFSPIHDEGNVMILEKTKMG